jgi:hypothetical protein
MSTLRALLVTLCLIALRIGAAGQSPTIAFKSDRFNFAVRYPRSWQLLEGFDGKPASTDALDIINFPNSQRAKGVVLKPGGAEITAAVAPPEVQTIRDWIEKDTKFNTEVDVHEITGVAKKSSVCEQLIEVTSLFKVGPGRKFHITSYYCSTRRGLFGVELKNWNGDPNQRQLQPTALRVLYTLQWERVARASGACSSPSRLTDDEARTLLYVTPAAVLARRAGTDVDLERSEPTREFPAVDYFVAAIVSRKPTAGTVLGNGILGYFAVDKRTGSVESVGDFTPVEGKELARVQKWMRHAHCIKSN